MSLLARHLVARGEEEHDDKDSNVHPELPGDEFFRDRFTSLKFGVDLVLGREARPALGEDEGDTSHEDVGSDERCSIEDHVPAKFES